MARNARLTWPARCPYSPEINRPGGGKYRRGAPSTMAKVKHIALIQFKADTTPEQIDQVFSALLDLSESIPGVEDFISGPNNSPEALAGGHTHAFIMTLADAAARDAYLTHPEHQAFVQNNLPLIEKVTVVDFEL